MVERNPGFYLCQKDVFEVDKLVAVKVVKGKKLYRVRWRGYGKESDTLEPEENLLLCKDMIEDLERKLEEKNERKKNKNSLKSPPYCKDPSTPSWQSAETSSPSDSSSHDNFWRDFDEEKICVADKDMSSKVKERSSKVISPDEQPSSSSSLSPKTSENNSEETLKPLLCPKVVLKRKPSNNETSSEGLTYKSSLKVIKKRKKYDVLRDYRRRKSRMHRKRRLDENGRRKLAFRSLQEKQSESLNGTDGNPKILQELLINDESKPEYAQANAAVVPLKNKDLKIKFLKGSARANDVAKSSTLMCRISAKQDAESLYSSFKKGIQKTSLESTKSDGSDKDTILQKVLSALLDAVVGDKVEKVEKLCNNNSVVNCAKVDGTTALMVAAKMGRYYMTKVLLKANAHKDKQNKRGETALMLACKNGHTKTAKLLLENGANFTLVNIEGVNVLRITNRARHFEVKKLLVDHIIKIVSKFETEARSQVKQLAHIRHALFPTQCFSLNEGPKYYLNFQHHTKLESPEKKGSQNLLFIARAIIKSHSIQCKFDADSLIKNISINGSSQKVFDDSVSSVFKLIGLRDGSNELSITTSHYPESEVKLIVCAYTVHSNTVCFPTQKLKNEF